MIQIVFAGQKCLHNLSYNHQGRVAGVVIDVFQTDIDSLFIIVWQYFQLVSGSVESWLQDIKVDRRHLRTQYGVGLPHFFGKYDFLN